MRQHRITGQIEVPDVMPPVIVERAEQTIKWVDCPELQWWQVVPRVGDRTLKAFYECYSGQLDWTERVTSVVPAGADGTVLMTIEESAHRFGPNGSEATARADRPGATVRFVCRLDDDRARWLRVEFEEPSGETYSTDERDTDFHQHWGDTRTRRLVNGQRFQRQPDGTVVTTNDEALGEGTYHVTVGDRRFTCLRVLDYRTTDEEFGESFIDRSGRTILYRQFRPISTNSDWRAWQQQHPDGLEMTIDGELFMHRDCTGMTHVVLTSTALALL